MDDNETVKLDQVRVVSHAAKHPVLIVLQGDDIGTSVPLEGKAFTVGRGTDCDIRLDDNLPYRLLKYRLRADGSASLPSLIFHTLRWPGERLPIRLKMLLKNLRRAPKETSLPAVAWASRPR